MKDIAAWALETAKLRGASWPKPALWTSATARWRPRTARLAARPTPRSLGIGIRVIAGGAFGFAATDDLSREGVQNCAAEAVEIAKASATVKSQELHWCPSRLRRRSGPRPARSIRSASPSRRTWSLLFAIDEELRKMKGVTLAETNMNFRRYEQWFYSTEGSEIHQTIDYLRVRATPRTLSKERDPEALVSQLVRRAISEQGLRADRGA